MKKRNSKLQSKELNKSDPTLEDRAYEPDIHSHNFKWTTKIFRDKETGVLVALSLPYLMPQTSEGVILGFYDSQEKIIGMDITRSDYEITYKHEVRHAKGDDEYLAEYNAYSRDYSMAA